MRNAFGVASVLLVTWISQGISAATWYVDGSVSSSGDGKSAVTAFKKIQEGIDAASHGDTVVVAEGTYVENVKFKGKNIVLTGTESLDPDIVKNTIIDGNQAGSVVTLAGTENETCALSGFTIRNGKADGGGGVSGGSRENRSRATIQNNTITGNSADSFGGGLIECGGTIRGNAINGNWAAVGGGGLAGCDGTIRGNTINGNWAAVGGGLVACEGIIENNTIAGNSAGYDGGGLCMCEGMVHNNAITANSAGHGSGGGLYDCFGTIENNTITGNSASSGGGLYGCDAVILNCIIWGNTASRVDPQLCSSRTPSYSCVEGWTGGGEGNTAEDPKFADADGPDDTPDTYEDNDYRLSEGSPCVDAGRNEDWMWSGTDLDGNPRIAFGASSLTVDMGAYEYAFKLQISEVLREAGGGIKLTWTSRPGDTYTVWSSTDLTAPTWAEEATLASQGTSTCWIDTTSAAPYKFYRMQLK